MPVLDIQHIRPPVDHEGYSDCVEYVVNVSNLRQTSDGFAPSYRELHNPDLMLLLYIRADTIVGA